jgi:hypothetical protein
MLPNTFRKAAPGWLSTSFVVAFALGSATEVLALEGYYLGLWAAHAGTCKSTGSPDRLLLEPTNLLSPQLQCKFLGVRQDDETGTTFMARCNDSTIQWNDEVTVKADSIKLSLKLRSEGRERQLVRCKARPQSNKTSKAIWWEPP